MAKRLNKYFKTLAIKNYINKKIIDKGYIKYIAKNISLSEPYVRSEYKKAKSYVYHRVVYLRNNKRVLLLSARTGIPIPKLIKLILLGDLRLNKDGIESFLRICEAAMPEVPALSLKQNNSFAVGDLDGFLHVFLKKQLEVVKQDKLYTKVMPDGSLFFSNHAVYNALKEYFCVVGIDVGTPAAAKKYMVKLVNQLRDKKLLAKKITEGYYSNSFKVEKDGKEITEYGVFVKDFTNN